MKLAAIAAAVFSPPHSCSLIPKGCINSVKSDFTSSVVNTLPYVITNHENYRRLERLITLAVEQQIDVLVCLSQITVPGRHPTADAHERDFTVARPQNRCFLGVLRIVILVSSASLWERNDFETARHREQVTEHVKGFERIHN